MAIPPFLSASEASVIYRFLVFMGLCIWRMVYVRSWTRPVAVFDGTDDKTVAGKLSTISA